MHVETVGNVSLEKSGRCGAVIVGPCRVDGAAIGRVELNYDDAKVFDRKISMACHESD